MLAVVGPMTAEDADQMARCLRRAAALGVAFLVDTASWTTLAPRAQAAAAATFASNRDVLAAAGWRVLPVRRGDDLADLWRDTGAGLASATAREALALTPR
jgi:hypothetical protein